MWSDSDRQREAREREALAREIAEDCRLRMPEARAVARDQIPQLRRFAAQWDAAARNHRPRRTPAA